MNTAKYMIINASRRTDIPAFYSDWFMNRIAEGYVKIRNPFNYNQIRQVSLLPKDVDLIVFWTRNAEKLIPRLIELDERGYSYYFHYTINAYSRNIDKSVPNPWRAIKTFIELSKKIGSEKVIWRYSPILVSNLSSIDEHKRVFEKIATELSGYSTKVVISFVNMYKKVSSNIRKIQGFSVEQDFPYSEEAGALAHYFADIARKNKMTIQSCGSEVDLESFGVKSGKCIDSSLIRDLFAIEVPNRKDKVQRLLCGCIESIDIGQYDSCLHGCQYCYATDHSKAFLNFDRHNPQSPLLLGDCPPVQLEKDEENIIVQRSLF